MGDAAADAAMYRFWADMLDAHGEHWPDSLVDRLVIDRDAPPIDLPLVDNPDDILVGITLRIPMRAYQRLSTRADDRGLTVEEFLLAQADAVEPTSPNSSSELDN